MNREVVLIDLSSIIHPIWHMSASEPDPNHCSQATVARVHALAADHPHVAICCDSGRSFRHDIDESYKANRPAKDETLRHQMALAIEALTRDGFPVWGCPNFEADDLIATATRVALEQPDTSVLIVTADKDLLQLVGPKVAAKSTRDGSVLDAEGVGQKFGVRPEQIRDYLTLVGDSSDNIKGAEGIGPKKATALLAKFKTLDELYEEMDAVGPGALEIAPAVAASLRAFRPNLEKTRALVTLRADAPIPFERVFDRRVSEAERAFVAEAEHAEPEPDTSEPAPAPPAATDAPRATTETVPAPSVQAAPEVVPAAASATSSGPRAMVVRDPDVLAPAPPEWERQLDPRSMNDARVLATDMHASRMFSAYGSPQAVLSTVMVGRELGLPAMSSLRSIHNIEGKHALAASLMVALILRSGLAEYFEPISFSEIEATYETLRKGARNPVRLTHTFEMAQKAWPKEKPDWEKRFMASGWGRNPTDMLVARATSRLARMIYPDLMAGLYTPEELAEIREQQEGRHAA